MSQSMRWDEGRSILRKALAAYTKPERRLGDDAHIQTLEATFICACLAHMRGKIHMRWFRKYERGWQGAFSVSQKTIVNLPEMKAAYGDMAQRYYNCSVIENLDDQKAWITWAAKQFYQHYTPGVGGSRVGKWDHVFYVPEHLRELSKHVIAEDWEETLDKNNEALKIAADAPIA